MKQLNVNITKEFERDLRLVMKTGRIKGKSEAVRQAVHESAERARRNGITALSALRGLALKYPKNPKPRFQNEDDLW